MTSVEFAEYVELFRREDEAKTKHDKFDIYASALIAETRRSYWSDITKVRNDDFLVDYGLKEKDPPPEEKPELTEEQKKERNTNRLGMEKAHWAILSGKIGTSKLRPKKGK